MKIGFIGLGVMGGPMARDIRGAGHDLVVFDGVDETVAAFGDAGADEDVILARRDYLKPRQ
jgi:3-hydroxyisobutyrate dehydrogenase-like beta-hydroxyacid dehydrogenase